MTQFLGNAMSINAIPATVIDTQAQVSQWLRGYLFRYRNEDDVHAAIATILSERQMPVEHEFVLDKKNRVDFYLDGLVIEVKVDGSFPQALQQIDRYCALPQVTGVVLASTRRWDPSAMPTHLRGKPVTLVLLKRAFL